MKNSKNFSLVWIKASVIASVWASAEIIFGSFLHNLKIPFSGSVMTAISLIILICFSVKWKEKGLFWRAGLITAFLKTLSPSAVIFGPMIAIFMQGVIVEFSLRLLGRNVSAFLTAAILAMSWNLFQKLVNYLFYYGTDIIKIYSEIVKYSQKYIKVETDLFWLPLILMISVYMLFGIITGFSASKISKKINLIDVSTLNQSNLNISKTNDFNYSGKWLVINFLMFIGCFYLINFENFLISFPVCLAVIILWVYKYKRALKQLFKPKLWVMFFLITILTTLLFSKTSDMSSGFLLGIKVNLRSIIIILGLAVIGTELYNPKIRNFFTGSRFNNLQKGIELSVNLLPYTIKYLPEFNILKKNPVLVFSILFSVAEKRLSEILKSEKVIIITGKRDEGKTTFIKTLVNSLKKNEISVGGFYSDKLFEDNEITGYDICDVNGNDTQQFLDVAENSSENKVGKFYINQNGINFGKKLLESGSQILFIDEIGKLELNNGGKSDSFSILLDNKKQMKIITVRTKYLKEISQKWNLEFSEVFYVNQNKNEEVINKIKNKINIL